MEPVTTPLRASIPPATSKTDRTRDHDLILTNIIRMTKTRRSRQQGGGFWSWLTTSRDARRRRRDILNTIGNEPDPVGSDALTNQRLRFARPIIRQGQCSKTGASNALAEAVSNIGRARAGIEYYLSNANVLQSDPNANFLDSALVQLSQAIKAIQSQQSCIRAVQGGKRRRTRRKGGKRSRR